MDTQANPANSRLPSITEENRVPMSLPEQMLQVPSIEGYEMYWFADRPGRISRAIAAGWQFVEPGEVKINNFSLAGDFLKDGNTDLGSRVSLHGGVNEQGASERLYLMKCKKEWYDKDMAAREARNDAVAAALRGGNVGSEKENRDDANKRYSKVTTNLFTKKR